MTTTKATRTSVAKSMHTAGIFSDMTVDGPEIGTLVVIVDRAKNLPNRRTMSKQDPYCAARLGKEAKKTETDKRGGQTPKWDHEMRFTVHDSPDYQNLKVSVFNDDKKTDLIGETWVNLEKVVMPGGGQSDMWHPLNCKGKYAGEVRIEMTYYDTRAKAEKPAESQEGEGQNTNGGQRSSVGGPRHETPVKRRPLPADPTGQTPSPQGRVDAAARVPLPQSGPRSYHTPPRLEHMPRSLPADLEVKHSRGSHGHDDPRLQLEDLRRHRSEISPAHSQALSNSAMSNSPAPSHHPMDHSPLSRYGHDQRIDEYKAPADDDRIDDEQQVYNRTHHRARSDLAYMNRHAHPQPPSSDPAYTSSLAEYEDNHSLHENYPTIPTKHRHHHGLPQSGLVPRLPQYETVSAGLPEDRLSHPSFPSVRHDEFTPGQGYPNRNEHHVSHDYDDSLMQHGHRSLPNVAMNEPSSSSDLNGTDRQSYNERYSNHAGTRPMPYMQPTVEDEDAPPPPPLHRSSLPTNVHSNTSWRHSYHADMRPAPLTARGRASESSPVQESDSPDYRRQSGGPPFGAMPSQLRISPLRSSVSSANMHDQFGRPASRGMTGQPFPDDSYITESSVSVNQSFAMSGEQHRPRGHSEDESGAYAIVPHSQAHDYLPPSQEYRGDMNNSELFIPPAYAVAGNGNPSRQQVVPQHRPGGREYASPVDSPTHVRSTHDTAPLIKPRAMSPEMRPPSQQSRVTPTRKSISPRPPPDREASPSSIPFSPDSYDAFNPAARSLEKSTSAGSMVKGTIGTRQAAYSSSESQDSDQPIIGSDGRVIDPSDHLPVEAWAPEPERKTPSKPKPIRVRVGLRGAQPMPAQKRDGYDSPVTNNPGGISPIAHTTARSMDSGPIPTTSTITTSSGGRTRLVKKAPRGLSQPQPQLLQENEDFGSGGPVYGGISGGGQRSRLAQSQAQSPPPIPAKIPLSSASAPPPAAAPEELVALSEEMKTIDIGRSSGGWGRMRRSRFVA